MAAAAGDSTPVREFNGEDEEEIAARPENEDETTGGDGVFRALRMVASRTGLFRL